MSNPNTDGKKTTDGQQQPNGGANPQAGNGGTQQTEQKKEGILKRFGNWCKCHKEAIVTGAVAFVGGAGTAIGAGYALNKHAERRAREMTASCVAPQEPTVGGDYSPLDPNL